MVMDVLMRCIDLPRARRQNWALGCLAKIEKMNVTNLFICCLYLNVLKRTGDGDVFFFCKHIESLNDDRLEPAAAT